MWRRLSDEGFSLYAIGQAVGRHHTKIMRALRKALTEIWLPVLSGSRTERRGIKPVRHGKRRLVELRLPRSKLCRYLNSSRAAPPRSCARQNTK
jgi:hypothetical protein